MKREQEIRAGRGSLRGNWRGQGSWRREMKRELEGGVGRKTGGARVAEKGRWRVAEEGDGGGLEMGGRVGGRIGRAGGAGEDSWRGS